MNDHLAQRSGYTSDFSTYYLPALQVSTPVPADLVPLLSRNPAQRAEAGLATPSQPVVAVGPKSNPEPMNTEETLDLVKSVAKPKVAMQIQVIPPFGTKTAKPPAISIPDSASQAVPLSWTEPGQKKEPELKVAPSPPPAIPSPSAPVSSAPVPSAASGSAAVAHLNPSASSFVFKPNPKASSFTPVSTGGPRAILISLLTAYSAILLQTAYVAVNRIASGSGQSPRAVLSPLAESRQVRISH